MIEFLNPTKGKELEIPELAAARGLSGARFATEATYQGGMGICLKLRHVGTNEAFALKVIKPEFLGAQSTWGRFVEELKWWLTLSACDGVAEAHCLTRVNEIPCMCAAWLHHGNLRQFVGPQKPEFIFLTMMRVVRTLEWAYTNHKVIHRDLKPENILLDQDWRAFVSDWGLAKALDTFFEESRLGRGGVVVASPHLTQPGQIVGTVLYAAPEQLLGLPSIDHRADIYSLGCMMFEWETGHPPFLGRTHDDIAQQHVHLPPPQLGGSSRKTNLGLEEVIARCLEKDPQRRFHDYGSLAEAILAVAQTRHFRVNDFRPAERYHRARPGSDELQTQLQKIEYSPQGYASIPQEEFLKHIELAMAESALGNYAKAAKTLAPFYIAEMCRETKSWTIYHTVAVNYGLFLSQSHSDQKQAIQVFATLSEAQPKPPEYFVNYSLAFIRSQDFERTETVARAGLTAYPRDLDLLGNLSIALRLQNKLNEAIEVANRRLTFGRDIHALEDAGNILHSIADEQRDRAKALEYYNAALAHLTEAKTLNPRYITVRVALAMLLRKLRRFGDAADEVQAIRQFAENRSQYETGALLMAELLADVNKPQECIDFCNEWIPTLQIPHNKDWMEGIRARALDSKPPR